MHAAQAEALGARGTSARRPSVRYELLQHCSRPACAVVRARPSVLSPPPLARGRRRSPCFTMPLRRCARTARLDAPPAARLLLLLLLLRLLRLRLRRRSLAAAPLLLLRRRLRQRQALVLRGSRRVSRPAPSAASSCSGLAEHWQARLPAAKAALLRLRCAAAPRGCCGHCLLRRRVCRRGLARFVGRVGRVLDGRA
jgi:hypothetical protein